MRGLGLGLLLLTTATAAVGQEPAAPDAVASCFRRDPESCPAPRIWGGADYLLWWVRKSPAPPLVVTGDPADAFPGALDQPGTRVLFGGDTGLDYGATSGLRLN